MSFRSTFMLLRTGIFAVLGIAAVAGLTSCAGGGGASGAPAAASSTAPAPSTQSVDVSLGAAEVTAALPFGGGLSGSMVLRSATPNAALEIGIAAPPHGRATTLSHGTCPPVPPIALTNPFPFPITITLGPFTVKLPCSVNGQLFGASSYQTNPVPQPLVSTKLGDATGVGQRITFTPVVTQLTFPAFATLTISILPETSKAFAQLPAMANTTTVLTSNAPAVPNSLSFAFPTVTGGTTFQSACYLPGDPNGPGLGGVNVFGTPAFYCVLVPGQGQTNTTFGGTVTFTLGSNAKPDASLIGLDGPQIVAGCTPVSGGQTCATPSFAIPAYSKAYVSNAADLAVCVPSVPDGDCNGVAGNPKVPSATSVPNGSAFALLFADDPTYNAPNTFGGVTLQVTGNSPACAIVLGPDQSGDAPPSYSDPASPPGATPTLADFTGAGPYVEFDIQAAAWPGTCAINLTEDTGLKRTFAFTIPVQ